MANETKLRLKKNTFTSTVGVAEQHRQDEKTRGGRDPRERAEKTQREAHKRSKRLFNFHIRCDIYKLPQQSKGGGGCRRGQEEQDPGTHMGFWLRCHVITGGGGWLTQIGGGGAYLTGYDVFG